MGTQHARGGYSADVRIGLLIGDERYNLAQLGPDFIILREAPEDMGVTEGVIRLAIDNHIDDFSVTFPEGLKPVGEVTPIKKVKSSEKD